jgi:hypothetical protein
MNQEHRKLYDAAMATDAAWGKELRHVFGKSAGNARYLPEGKGDTTSELRRLYDEARAAREAWEPVSLALACGVAL